MRLLVLGATGATGRHIVTQALDAGHEVTAFVRDPSRVGVSHDRLHVAIGTVTDEGPLAKAMKDQDAAISALGRGYSFKSMNLIQQAVPAILAAMRTQGVRRLIFTSAMGVGESFQDAPLMPRAFFRTLLRGIYADKAIGDRLIQGSDLDWTIVRPTQMTDGPLTGKYRFGERLALKGMPSISRADTAQFIVRQVDDPTFRRRVVLCSY